MGSDPESPVVRGADPDPYLNVTNPQHCLPCSFSFIIIYLQSKGVGSFYSCCLFEAESARLF
jgi:hypothetical protein